MAEEWKAGVMCVNVGQHDELGFKLFCTTVLGRMPGHKPTRSCTSPPWSDAVDTAEPDRLWPFRSSGTHTLNRTGRERQAAGREGWENSSTRRATSIAGSGRACGHRPVVMGGHECEQGSAAYAAVGLGVRQLVLEVRDLAVVFSVRASLIVVVVRG